MIIILLLYSMLRAGGIRPEASQRQGSFLHSRHRYYHVVLQLSCWPVRVQYDIEIRYKQQSIKLSRET